MNYVREESMVIYKSKDGKNTKEFDAVDFIASLASHIPNKSEQMVRYYGLCKALHNQHNGFSIKAGTEFACWAWTSPIFERSPASGFQLSSLDNTGWLEIILLTSSSSSAFTNFNNKFKLSTKSLPHLLRF
ncbi:MAG: transposase [Actinobacteria bacterium]|nr:transposase [Chloroflexota bacterium]MBE3138824.1 transposase [Actinomycetota bacterium]